MRERQKAEVADLARPKGKLADVATKAMMVIRSSSVRAAGGGLAPPSYFPLTEGGRRVK
jgi:hypothetical protein